jgi:nitroimidazol reductase NimA-like FMN-containing flavoprotein (pyridoxamine 5'-phosphate oxidase superfamily)
MSTAGLEPLTFDECLLRLREHEVGRIALVVDEFPMVVPVNYRLVVLPGTHWIAIRTRRGGLIQSAGIQVAFEIDEIESSTRSGWSVVARGTLHSVDQEAGDFAERFPPDSWVMHADEVWMVIDVFQITGRRVGASPGVWELDVESARSPRS